MHPFILIMASCPCYVGLVVWVLWTHATWTIGDTYCHRYVSYGHTCRT